MSKGELMLSIIRLLSLADEEALKNIYHFVVHRV